MARSQLVDPLLSHHFALLDVPVVGVFPFAFPLKAAVSAIQSRSYVGMASISIPEVTLDIREIKEGNWPFAHKVTTGHVSMGQAVLSMAVLPINVDMSTWIKQAIWGRIVPRRSLLVVHLGPDKLIPRRMLLMEHCLPSAWKPSGDLDASGAQVLLEELTLEVHSVSVVPI